MIGITNMANLTGFIEVGGPTDSWSTNTTTKMVAGTDIA